MGLIMEFFGLSEITGGLASPCMFSGVAGIFPSFEGDNANIAKLAFIMAVMIFVLGLSRLVFRRKDD